MMGMFEINSGDTLEDMAVSEKYFHPWSARRINSQPSREMYHVHSTSRPVRCFMTTARVPFKARDYVKPIAYAFSGWLLLVTYSIYDFVNYDTLVYEHVVNSSHSYEFFFHLIMLLAPVISSFAGWLEYKKNLLVEELRTTSVLQHAISTIQSMVITNIPAKTIFNRVLTDLLALSKSEYGFIGEVMAGADGRPYLKTHAMTNVAWDDETRLLYAENEKSGLEYFNLNTLFGQVMVTGQMVISNDPHTDPRRGGIPDGHPQMNSFLGIPFYHGDTMVGMAGVANRPAGYDGQTLRYLEPLFQSIANIINAYRVDQLRQLAEARLLEEHIALEAEKELLAVTLRSIGDAVIVTDSRGVVTLFNQIAELNTGWTANEAVGRPVSEIVRIIREKTRESCRNPVDAALDSGMAVSLGPENLLSRKDGSEILIEDSAAAIRNHSNEIIGAVLVFRDITEKKRVEEELVKAQKLESVGLLAGGLAHDFNNLLTSILGNISLAKMLIGGGHHAYDRLEDAENASLRATDLTTQLLTFSRGGAPIRKTVSIVDIVRESARFTLAGSKVKVEFHLPEDTWHVHVDAGQIHQVLNNLLINAVQSMPNGGTITARATNTTLAATDVPMLSAGKYVMVSLQDTGTGIPSEHLSRIFDPYFTTKQRGNGLGLSTVYSIAVKHDGHVAVESTLGVGTTFHLYLPASHQQADPLSPLVSEAAPGCGRILVMDDDELILDIAGNMLTSLGYEAVFAREGGEAIGIYQQALLSGTPFDMVIMDLTIPGGIGGKEAIQQLGTLDPAVKAIVSSGYSNDPIMAEYESHGFAGVIAKPYTIEGLSRVLRDVQAR